MAGGKHEHSDVLVGLDMRANLVGARPQLRDRHFSIAFGRPAFGKHAARVKTDYDATEAPDVVISGGVGGMPSSFIEHHLDRLLAAIDDNASVLGKIDRGAFAAAVVGHEHAIPSARLRDLSNVEVDVRELIEKHSRLDLAFGLGRDDVERDLSETLIAGGHRHQQHVCGRGAAQHRHEPDRSEEPSHTDAAGLERHELAIGREAAERHQQSHQQRHRDSEAERHRQQREDDLNDG